MNSKKKGNVGIGAAIAYFTKLGCTVSIPLTDSQEYDLIVDMDGVLKKVQVKTTSQRKGDGPYRVQLRTCGGNQSFHTVKHFNGGLVDLMFILTASGERYLMPTNDKSPKSNMVLGEKYREFRVS